jgi:hypothetical protein
VTRSPIDVKAYVVAAAAAAAAAAAVVDVIASFASGWFELALRS